MNQKTITAVGILFVITTIAACSKKINPTVSTEAKKVVSSTLTATELEGQKIYTVKCGTCHGLKEPREYTSKEWVPILNSMAKKANLTDGEKFSVAAYVNKNARIIK